MGAVLSLWKGMIRTDPTMAEIVAQVAAEYGVTVDDIKSVWRTPEIVRPRQDAMWRLRQQGRWTLPQIGRFLNRDHSTVILGIRAHERRLGQNGELS